LTHIKELKYEPPKQERDHEDDDDEDDYDYHENFVEDEALMYDKKNVGNVGSPYLMPYVYNLTHNMASVRTVIYS